MDQGWREAEEFRTKCKGRLVKCHPTKLIHFDLTGSRWSEAGQSIAVISPVMREGCLAIALATTTGGLREEERLVVSFRHDRVA